MAKKSSRLRLQVDGIDDVNKAIKKFDDEMKKELHDLISQAAEIVFREADARVPIRSGEARDSLRIETGTTKKGYFFANVVVGNDKAFYIVFYELGTAHQPKRPFMRPALDKSKNKIRELVIKGLKEIIEKDRGVGHV